MYPMNRFALSIGLLALFAASHVLAGAEGSPIPLKKHLPLDGVRDVVMKTPSNSSYAPDRILVKLAPGIPGAGRSNAFGVAAVDNFIRRYSPRAVRRMFPQHTRVQKPGGVDLTRFYEIEYSLPIHAF